MKTQNKMKAQNNLSAVELSDDLEDEPRPEYDRTALKKGVRGKYLAQYRSGTNLILLDSDAAKFLSNNGSGD